MVRLAIERMNEEIEKLKTLVEQQQAEMQELRKVPVITTTPNLSTSQEDEYLDSRDVQKILGVCYNTLQKIVKQGLIKPIRINQRRFRYSKMAVMNYLRQI